MCKRAKKEAYLVPTFDDVPLLSTLTQSFLHAKVLNKQVEKAYSDNIKGLAH
jgi:hypothetical protein